MPLPAIYSLMDEFPYVDAFSEPPKGAKATPPPDTLDHHLTPDEARRVAARGAIVLPDPEP
ncbi:MAG: hypothetical protein ABIY70_21210 [Capsulimonas sp.]|uniref:hypothetical protein n=1 Tax=Capsulimonas sp. TaxID=2494211 RepID=UPI003267CA6E